MHKHLEEVEEGKMESKGGWTTTKQLIIERRGCHEGMRHGGAMRA